MATVTTTTVSSPLPYPSQTPIERVRSGDLWVMVAATTANTYELWRSQNAGGSWTLALSTVRANLQELGCIQAMRGPYNQLFWIYRTYETGADRVFCRTISDLGAATLAWNAEVPVAAAVAGSAGAVLSGVDMQNVVANGQIYVIAGIGIQSGANRGAHFNVLSGLTVASLSQNNNLFSGTRLWTPEAGTGRVTPSVDIEHTGDGHSSSAPHVWMSFGRTQVYTVKCSWTGSGWSGPAAPVKHNPVTLTPAQDSIAARWDGARFVTAVPDPTSTSVVTLFERNQSNSVTTIRQTPTHPTGVVRNCTLGYNSVSGDIRVYAVGTSTAVLYYTDFIRATGLWSAWAQVVATAVLGTTGSNYAVRRATDGRYEVLTAHAGSPNTIVHTAQSLSYTPNAPTWDTAAMQLPSGTAADVNAPLTLDWTFTDPDPADTQSAFAVSRQIGAGTLAYWRASDSTWQPAEVQNTSATSAISMAAGWQAATDAVTAYKAKAWDSASLPSAYGDALMLVPSAKVNPSITSPAAAAVLTADTVTVTWTVAEQSAYRLTLDPNPAHLNTNPFFETNAAGWSVFGGTFVRSTAQFHEGAAAGLLTPDGVSATAQVVFQPAVSVTPGAVYRGAAWVRCAVARTVRLAFDFLTAGVTNVSFAVPATTWTLIEYAMPAPAGATQIQWWVAMDGTPAAGNLLYIDEAGIRPPAYFDTGWLSDAVTSSLQLPYRLGDLTAWTVSLQTRNAEGLPSLTAAVPFTIDFVEPAAATGTPTPDPVNGAISVAVVNPAAAGAQPAVTSQDVYARRTAGTSAVTNPGFETNTTGWAATGGALTRSTAQFHTGAASGLITPDGVTATPKVAATSAQALTVAEGQQVTADGWLRPATANKPVTIGVDWLDAGNALVSSSVQAFSPIAGAWLYCQATFPVPIGVSVVKAVLRYGLTTTPAAGDLLYGDDLRLRTASADAGLVVASAVGTGVTVADWHAISGVDYEYRVLTRGANGTSIFGPWTA